MNRQQTDEIFNRITANGNREMTEERFYQAVNELLRSQLIEYHEFLDYKLCDEMSEIENNVDLFLGFNLNNKI